MWVRTHTEMGSPKWFVQSCHHGAFAPGVLLSVLGHEDVPFRKITGLIKENQDALQGEV